MNLKDLLDRSLLQQGKLVPNLEQISLKNLLKEVIEIMQCQADLRKINIHYNVEDETQDMFMLDVQRMMQVLINLISNAIKFSKQGGDIYIDVTKTI